jgi:hypothetical protein
VQDGPIVCLAELDWPAHLNDGEGLNPPGMSGDCLKR